MRHVALTETLMRELEVNPDKSLQGGLRAARRAVRLLNELGRSSQVNKTHRQCLLICDLIALFQYFPKSLKK